MNEGVDILFYAVSIHLVTTYNNWPDTKMFEQYNCKFFGLYTKFTTY